MNITNITILLAVLSISANAYSGGEKPDGQMPRGGNENNIGVYSNSQGGEGGRGGFGGNVNDGAIRNNVTGIAAGGVTAQGGGSESTFSVDGRGIGNNSFNYPRQTPMAYAPSSYSANPCIMNYSAGGSGAPFGFSLGVSAESDECNARADSVRFQELNMPPVACQRMLVDSDENQEAMKASGMNCNNAGHVGVAMPTSMIVPSQTPTLDYVTRPELNQKLDNAQRLGVIK